MKMNLKLIKMLVFGLGLGLGWGAIASELPSKNKTEQDLLRRQWQDERSQNVVTLESGDGVQFQILVKDAEQSKTVEDLLEDAGFDHPIPLPNIDGATLKILVNLMRELDFLQWRSIQDPLFYIPRAFQPTIDKALKGKSIERVVAAFIAANFLDIPFVLNGVAAVIADRIPKGPFDTDVPEGFVQNWYVKDVMQFPAEQRNEAIKLLSRQNLAFIAHLDRNLWKFIVRHLVHRQCGITQEYSIADYINEHGYPKVNWGVVDFNAKRLTSLFGIQLLQRKYEIGSLFLSWNCFFDLFLDPQGVLQPFNEFVNVEVLYFYNSQLTQLHIGLFEGLTKLSTLFLMHNQLTQLPVGLFSGLLNLCNLNLMGNQLNQEEQQRIREELPEAVKIEF